MAKKCMAGIIIVLILLNINSLIFKSPKRYEAEFITVFDTVTKIISYSNSKAEFEKHSKLIYDNLMKYHKLFDIYNNYEGINNIKTINDNVGIAPVKVDREIIDLLLFAKQVYYKTDGKVNVAFGAVLKIWHNYRTQGIENPSRAEVPPIHLLKEAEKHTDINNLIINEADSTVYLADPYMSLDVGAIAKGYATEKVSLYAKQHEFTSGVISVGGNVRAIGNKIIDRQPWNIGVQNPDKESKQSNLVTVHLNDMSLVTSGSYERYYTAGGKKYHHIIDPLTLFPAEYITSVTILCKDSAIADALSTAVFNMPFEQGLALIESLPDTEALWVLNNKEIKTSSNFKSYTKLK